MSITCGLTNPLLFSHHDLILSSFPSLLEPNTTPPQAFRTIPLSATP